MEGTPTDSSWHRLRYGPLLRAASRSVAASRGFAALAAAWEHRRDPNRRRVAEARIAAWLGVSPREASRIFRRALRSEALEEADAARWMASPAGARLPVEIAGFLPRGGRPRVYAALHAGSPVLAYLGLRAQYEPEARIIARELDERNPMPGVKQLFARRKVAWVEATAGARFIDTDPEAMLEARDHLLAGHPLFAAVDVPGDVVSRSDRVTLFGETVVLASGVFRLAALAGADMQLVISEHVDGRIRVRCRPPVEGADARSLLTALAVEMEEAIRERPEEFWFWPYFVSAPPGST